MKRIYVVLLLTVSGRATSAKYQSVLDTWIGEDAGKLVSTWGVPAKSYDVDSGTRMIEYVKENGRTLASDTMTVAFEGYKVIPNICTTTFTIRDSKIASYRFEGDGCKSK